MPLTPFQKRKLDRMFDVLDLNRDGFVEQADFVRRVREVARMQGWEQGSEKYTRNLEFAFEEWRNLRESVDLDQDSRVTRKEFQRWGEIFLDDRDAVRAFARGDVQLMFDAMDTDGDGKLTVDEYRAYLRACGVDASAADAFFAHADLDRDGRITRAEMAHAVEEFLVSEDPAAAGNFLYGPLEGGSATGGEDRTG